MKRKHKSGLPVELWRDVNRAAYAVAQARFATERAKLVNLALDMLDAGMTRPQVSVALLEREQRPTDPQFA